MATFKPVISSYKKSDGTRNVMICVFHNGEKRYPKTNFFLDKDDLTRSLKIKNQFYSDKINDIVKKCRDKCNKHADVLADYSVDKVVEITNNIIIGKNDKEHFELNFIKYGRDCAEQLKKEGRTGTATSYNIALNNLLKFTKGEEIDISKITTSFIKKWIEHLKENSKGGRTQSLYPSNIRAIHNRAKNDFNNEDTGEINIALSPFRNIKLPKQPETRKRALSVEKIRQISNLPDTQHNQIGTNRYNFARDMFMLSFLLVGMNEIDLFNCTDLTNDRITYQRAKVKNRRIDKGEISIKIEKEALPIVEKYRDKTGKRGFCFYQMYANVNTFSAAINGRERQNNRGETICTGLKQIGKELGIDDLEFYAARHSWATIARNDCEIDKYTIHEALNHVTEMKITDTYIKKDWSVIDKANRKVINYVFENKI